MNKVFRYKRNKNIQKSTDAKDNRKLEANKKKTTINHNGNISVDLWLQCEQTKL